MLSALRVRILSKFWSIEHISHMEASKGWPLFIFPWKLGYSRPPSGSISSYYVLMEGFVFWPLFYKKLPECLSAIGIKSPPCITSSIYQPANDQLGFLVMSGRNLEADIDSSRHMVERWLRVKDPCQIVEEQVASMPSKPFCPSALQAVERSWWLICLAATNLAPPW